MNLTGKGFFLWNSAECEDGDPERIAALVESGGLSHLIIKVADGDRINNVGQKSNQNQIPSIINTIKAHNISTWGCQISYGSNPEEEAKIAIKCIKELNLDGFVIDAGAEYKHKGGAVKASVYMARLRQALPTLPIALSSFKFPTQHQSFPWHAFLDECDLVMPKVFWLKTHGNAGKSLYRSVQEFQKINPNLSVCPTGPIFKTWGWIPYYDEIVDFLRTAELLGLQAINFFSLDSACHPIMKSLRELVFQSPWPSSKTQKGIVEQYMQTINLRKIHDLLSTYQENGTIILPSGTIKGKRKISNWYQKLFEKVSQNLFILERSIEDEGIYTFYWKTFDEISHTSLTAKNVVRLDKGKIISHYIEFFEGNIVFDQSNLF